MKVIVNPAQNPTQDIFKLGTLVISNHENEEFGTWVILVSHDIVRDSYKEDYFAGTVISSNVSPKRVGDHCMAWRKEEFVKFVGNVVLEQE